MLYTLLAREVDILRELYEDGGLYTGEIANRLGEKVMPGCNKRSKSMTVRADLLRLKSMRMVDYLDNKKPVCWVRTPRGTQYLVEHGHIEGE